MPERHFPPPWSVEELDIKLGQDCFIVRDANGQALAYVYLEDKPGRRAAAKLLTRDDAPAAHRREHHAANAPRGATHQKLPAGLLARGGVS